MFRHVFAAERKAIYAEGSKQTSDVTPASILQERLLALLALWAYEQRPCRHCGQLLYFVQLPAGTTAPGAFSAKDHWVMAYNSEGENHAGHCPGSRQRVPE